MGKIIGIDLGTTNSCVAVMEGGEPVVITNSDGNRTTPSVVSFDESDHATVGTSARRQAITNPKNTIYSAKRFMGRKYADMQTVKMPFSVVAADNGDVAFEIHERKMSPPEVSARVLMKLKEDAERYLGEEVTEAVVTVPAYFDDAQRQATTDAGKIAGLKVSRIINEPTSAALAFGFGKGKDTEQRIAVYDLGGGTFDISILEIGDNVVEVISTNGDTTLGGDDFDHVILKWVTDEFRKDTGIDLSGDPQAQQRLRDEAEKAKKDLSVRKETEINCPFICADPDTKAPQHINMKLTRAKFDGLVGHLVERSLEPCRQALEDAKVDTDSIDKVLLVGGSTRIPLVQRKVEEFFGRAPDHGVNPDEVVALGAAVQGGVLSGDVHDLVLVDVTPLSLGIETLGGVMTTLIERNTSIPTHKSEVFTTASDGQPSVEVHVLQGERSMAADNRTLGKFTLVGIPPAPRGVPQIEVSFDIDSNGIVQVSAKDKATGQHQKVTITSSSGLDKDEINRMVDDAKNFAEEDKKRRDEIEARNGLEAMILASQKVLEDHGDKVPGAVRSNVENAITDAKAAIVSEDPVQVNAAREQLQTASNAVGSAMYNQQQGPDEPHVEQEGAPSDDAPEEAVIDADFEEKAN